MLDQTMALLQTAPWQRHELLHVAPNAWATVLASGSLAEVPLLEAWVDRGWPVIVRRRMQGDGTDMVPIGVPLPPAAGKMRIALAIPPQAVVGRMAPPSLRVAAAAAKPAWQSTIAVLLALGARHGVEPAAFGSLLWEHRTGLAYLSSGSDLDVIWPIRSRCDVAALLTDIAVVEQAAPVRIDGEVIFPDGSAVNWRELKNALRSGGAAELLVKTIDGVRLRNIRSLPGCERLQ
jgi:phosphoribosyl-dephospho-CoA transferase